LCPKPIKEKTVSSIRDRILTADDTQSELVEIPEWGVTLEVRSMSGAARASLMQMAMESGGNVDITRVYPDLIVQTVFDPETGEQVFEEADKHAIMAKNGALLDKVVEVATRISGFSDNAIDEAGKDS
jgi:hypothetical protein